MRRFDASPRRATPKGHNPFITYTAPNSKIPYTTSSFVRGTPKIQEPPDVQRR